jgi:hypothetical protein
LEGAKAIRVSWDEKAAVGISSKDLWDRWRHLG